MSPRARAAAGAWLAACSLLAAAQTVPEPAAAVAAAASAPEAAEAVAPKLSPLLGLLLGKVLDATIEATTGDTTLGLFRRLARKVMGDDTPPADATATAATATATTATATTLAAAPSSSRSLVSTSSPALTPALGYAMEQLDPTSFALLRPIPVAGADPLLRTGDVFVLQFSTNLPGRVRMENTDPNGQVADLGTYTVLVDQLNRLPRDRGIQLQGQTGVEKLRFYFYPCMPPEGAGKPWAAEFQARLPPCGAAPQALQVASANTVGTVAPRALVNLSQPDANMVFAGATDYQAGEVTTMEARVRHERPAGAR